MDALRKIADEKRQWGRGGWFRIQWVPPPARSKTPKDQDGMVSGQQVTTEEGPKKSSLIANSVRMC